MAEGHWRIHQRQDTLLPSSIGSAAVPSITVTGIVSAPATSFATATLSFSDGIRTATVVNLSASGSGTTTTSDNARSTTASSTPSSATANTDASKSASNLSTLIPAIVASVAAVLIISFIMFWLFMRRRQKKAIENEPEFVMEGMKEKPHSRPVTADSNSSTRELVPNKNKETAINVREVDRSGPGMFAPPSIASAVDSRPGSRQAESKTIPNFSRGARPNTADRDAAPSPAPAFRPQERGESRDTHRPPPVSFGQKSKSGPRGPGQDGSAPRGASRPHNTRTGSFSRPLPPAIIKGQPPSIYTAPNQTRQDSKPTTSPSGAYNGSSPISQYSPIVKDMPKFGTSPTVTTSHAQPRSAGGSISSINDQGTRKPPPSAIQTNKSPFSLGTPTLTEDNARMARPVNNARLAFHSMVATTAATSPATEEPPTPSPRLPPPATRDAPPVNYNIPLPTHEPPAPASIQARLNGASISDRRSVVSGLSDDYVDMEVDDNKSDVSSLDEREKWQMQTETETAHSRQAGLGGYGGLAPRPPLLRPDAGSRGSDASGSQYSLGYYVRETTPGESR